MTDENRLGRLLALQQIDMEIMELEEQRADVPVRRAEAAGEITTLEAEEEQRDAELERVRLERRHLEGEMEEKQEKLARYDRQLSEVKTNVAYSALLSEIQAAKREISDLEDQILELMEARDENETRLTEVRALLTERREAARETLETLKAEADEIERRMEDAERRRAELAGHVDEGHLRMYNRVRRRRRFPALVPLKGRACGACFGSLPPQVVQEITHDAELHPCEACGSIVYNPEALDPEPETETAAGASAETG